MKIRVTELSRVSTLRSHGLLGYFTHLKKHKTFSEQKDFCGFLMDLYPSSAKSSTKS